MDPIPENAAKPDFITDLIMFIRKTKRFEEYIKNKHEKDIKNFTRNKYQIQWMFEVNWLGDGSQFGQDALISNRPRNATVVPTAECYVTVLDIDHYNLYLL